MNESPFDPREFWLRTVKFIEDQAKRENVRQAAGYMNNMNNWIQNHRDRYGLDYALSVENLGEPPAVPKALVVSSTAFPDYPSVQLSQTELVCDPVPIPRPAPPPAVGTNVFGLPAEWAGNSRALNAYGSSYEPKNRVEVNPANGKEYFLYTLKERGEFGHIFVWLPVGG